MTTSVEPEVTPAEWQYSLSVALKNWCDKNGYSVRNELAKELGINQGTWTHITVGNSITQPEIYASIFKKTGLAEADPRTIPPKNQYIPRTKEFVWLPRAWSDAQYENWRRNPPRSITPKSQVKSSKGGDRARAPSHPDGPIVPRTNVPTWDRVAKALEIPLDDLRQLFTEEADAALQRRLGSATLPEETGGLRYASDREFADLCRKLLEKLNALRTTGTKETRTAFADKHGQRLADLFPLVEGFALPDEKLRERHLAGIQVFEVGRAGS